MPDRHRIVLGLVLLCSLMIAAAFQGSRGLYETTEGRYAECARQTGLSGHWEEPVLNGHHHWTKPPLTYLCIGAGISLLGTNAWGARAYLIPAFFLTVAAVYGLGRLLWGREPGLYAAMVYATSPVPVIAGNSVSTDTLLVFWQACAMLLFWCAVRRGDRRCFIAMWAALGLAFLTKGPVALMPLLGIIPVHRMARRRDPSVPGMFSLAGLAVFFLTGLSWYLVEAFRHPGLLRYWLVDEVVKRNLQGKFDRNPEFYFVFLIYAPILLFGTGAWALLLFWKRKAFPRPGSGWRRFLREERGLPWTFLLLTFFLPLLLFSLSTSKLPLYMLPLFVPLSVAMGKGLAWLVARGRFSRRSALKLFTALAVLIVCCKGASAFLGSPQNMKQLSERIGPLLELRPRERVVIFDVKGLPWYGLQYYLQRTFPVTSFFDIVETIDRERSAGGAPPLFLLRRNERPFFLLAPNLAPYREVPVDPHWTLIECLPEGGRDPAR